MILGSGKLRQRLKLAELTIGALEVTARCSDVDEVLNYWARELADALAPYHVALFLAEGPRWRRLLPDDQEAAPPLVTEAMLAQSLATPEPIRAKAIARTDPHTVLLRYSIRDGWRGVLVLWSPGRRFSRERVAFARDVAAAIARSASVLRRTEISRGQAVTDERSRWAADLHDGHIQTLSSARLQADICLSLEERHQEVCLALGSSNEPSGVKRELERLHDLLIETLRESRQFLLELRPPPVSADLFVPWLKDYALDFERESGVPVELRIDGEGGLSAYQVEETTRLLREALTNVRKHAKAGLVRIALTSSESSVAISVSDDGVGFDVPSTLERLMDSSHNGLTGIRYRAESIGGDMRVRSEPGKGTTLLFRIPRSRKIPEVSRRRAPSATPPAQMPSLPAPAAARDSIRQRLTDFIGSFTEEDSAEWTSSDLPPPEEPR